MRKYINTKAPICEMSISIDAGSFSKGLLYRTTFKEPILLTEDDVMQSVWTKDGLKMTVNGVDIPSKTEVIK